MGICSLMREHYPNLLNGKKPRRIFVNSMGDTFHESVIGGWQRKIYNVIKACPQHTFIILTKRAKYLSTAAFASDVWYGDLPNVWLGVTVCNQEEANEKNSSVNADSCCCAVCEC